jgi:hypothetical protein
MSKVMLLLTGVVLLSITACKNAGNSAPQNEKVVLHFELDANGEIKEQDVREQVIAIGKEVESHGDKKIITAYTENSGNPEQDRLTAAAMAKAVRELMKKQGGRNGTCVGVDIKGYANPIDSLNPSDLVNRRVEIIGL